TLISLISMTFCFFLASFFFFCCSYLNLPKSRIFTTGGSAFGLISSRSRPATKSSDSALQRDAGAHPALHLAVLIDQSHLRGSYLLIDARPVAARGCGRNCSGY